MGSRAEKKMKARAAKRMAKARAMQEPGWKSTYAKRPGAGHWRDATEAELIARTDFRVGATDLFRDGKPVA